MKAAELLNRIQTVIGEGYESKIAFESEKDLQEFGKFLAKVPQSPLQKGSKGYYLVHSDYCYEMAEIISYTERQIAYNRGDKEVPAKVKLKLASGKMIETDVTFGFRFYEPVKFCKAYDEYTDSTAYKKKMEKNAMAFGKKLLKKMTLRGMPSRTFEVKHPTLGTRKFKISSSLEMEGFAVKFTVDVEPVGQKRVPWSVPQVIRYAQFEDGEVFRWYGTHPPKSIDDWMTFKMKVITPDTAAKEIKDIINVVAKEDRESYHDLFDKN